MLRDYSVKLGTIDYSIGLNSMLHNRKFKVQYLLSTQFIRNNLSFSLFYIWVNHSFYERKNSFVGIFTVPFSFALVFRAIEHLICGDEHFFK